MGLVRGGFIDLWLSGSDLLLWECAVQNGLGLINVALGYGGDDQGLLFRWQLPDLVHQVLNIRFDRRRVGHKIHSLFSGDRGKRLFQILIGLAVHGGHDGDELLVGDPRDLESQVLQLTRQIIRTGGRDVDILLARNGVQHPERIVIGPFID